MLIIDKFVKLNETVLTHKDILLKLDEMEKRVAGQDEKIQMIFQYLKQFIREQEAPRKKNRVQIAIKGLAQLELECHFTHLDTCLILNSLYTFKPIKRLSAIVANP